MGVLQEWSQGDASVRYTPKISWREMFLFAEHFSDLSLDLLVYTQLDGVDCHGIFFLFTESHFEIVFLGICWQDERP